MKTKRKSVTFKVERIVDEKVEKGKKYYLLKWEGYDSDENTWEPEEHIECPSLIEAYLRNRKSGKPSTESGCAKENKAKEKQTAASKRGGRTSIPASDKLDPAKAEGEGKALRRSKPYNANAETAKALRNFLLDSAKEREARAAARAKQPPQKRTKVADEKKKEKRTPIEIIGVAPAEPEEGEKGTLLFLTRFKETEVLEFVAREHMIRKHPGLVINFYESRVKWHGLNNDADQEAEDEHAVKEKQGVIAAP